MLLNVSFWTHARPAGADCYLSGNYVYVYPYKGSIKIRTVLNLRVRGTRIIRPVGRFNRFGWNRSITSRGSYMSSARLCIKLTLNYRKKIELRFQIERMNETNWFSRYNFFLFNRNAILLNQFTVYKSLNR